MKRLVAGLSLVGMILSGCSKQTPQHVLADDVAFTHDGSVTRYHDKGVVPGSSTQVLSPAENMKYHYFISFDKQSFEGREVHSISLKDGDLYWPPPSASGYTQTVAIASNEVDDHPLMHIGDMNGDGVADFIKFNAISSRELQDRFPEIVPKGNWTDGEKVRAMHSASEIYRRVKRDVIEKNPQRSLQ